MRSLSRRAFVIPLALGILSAAAFASTADIEALVRRVAARQPDLQRERDRNGRLKSELVGQASNAGCWKEQKVKKLEVLVGGNHLPNSESKRTSEESRGDAGLIKIVFSENFVAQIDNEEKYQLFASAGKYISQDFSDKLVRDITRLKIEKGGIHFNSQKVCSSSWLGIKTSCYYRKSETHRYSLGSITIKINDQVLFSRKGINHTFEGDNRVWEEKDLAVNPEYIKLMARNDCPANQ
jgi:hypothetical protein